MAHAHDADLVAETALTAHLVVDDPQGNRDLLLRAATRVLEERFKIRHITLQIESTDCPNDGHR